ncbi:MAG: hypothetical protein U9M90_03825 [Patescibacteria group bacterium]|nr:hypothetical protein [Patescibacteria group bacterium]
MNTGKRNGKILTGGILLLTKTMINVTTMDSSINEEPFLTDRKI